MKNFVKVETQDKEGMLHILSLTLKNGTVCPVDRSFFAGETMMGDDYCNRYEVVSGGHRRFVYEDERGRWFVV
ncbi:hypothetical protein LJC56_10410 [Christensenellaceae bacterium OttesenSCG-928-K19]|nr:hypothetical protein [Christensenellaceae bacterium OttesenSCG-928-K19]